VLAHTSRQPGSWLIWDVGQKMKKSALIVFCLVACAVVVLAMRKKEYAQISSPDGDFIAVAEYRAYSSWIPMSIGSGGDKAGWILLRTKEGREIGSASVPMISMVRDIRWTKEEASLVGVASWRLSKQ
jgi:hypothetical protein